MRSFRGGLFLSLIFLNLSGCSSAILLKETPLGLSETRRIIVKNYGEPRQMSENGREMWTQYVDKKDLVIEKPNQAKERRSVHFVILNDRRPYDIEIDVLVEGRADDGTYEVYDHDDQKAGEISRKLKKSLNESHVNRNVIDDFKSF